MKPIIGQCFILFLLIAFFWRELALIARNDRGSRDRHPMLAVFLFLTAIAQGVAIFNSLPS